MGDLRRLRPLSRNFGFDRGTPIRRYYIEHFLSAHAEDIRGKIIEVGDDRYARRFSAQGSEIEVLSPEANAGVIVGDLVSGAGVPRGRYDCAILTQVLHVLPDMRAAVATVHDSLAPGGVLLASLPCISQVSRFDMERWGDFWRTTDRGARHLIESRFLPDDLEVRAYGNHLSAIASLTGMAAEELTPEELLYSDPDFQVLVCVRARKGEGAR
jgi:SAM-dependent methyltransferase